MGNSWAAWQIAGANAIHHLDYGFNQLEESVNFNFPMLTSEVISTDRVAVRNSGILFSLATGGSSSIWSPSYHITWRNTDARLAALVTGASETELKVSLFSFAEGTLKLQALFWRLLPGRYEWRVASSDSGDSISQGKFELKERGQNLNLSLPSRKSLVLTVEQKTKAGSPRLSGMADLAVSSRDLEVLRGEERSILTATVHNIGSAEARNVRVLVTADDGSEVMNEKLDQLPPPHALQPSVRQFTKSVKLGNAERLGLRVSSETPEICSTNNQTEARLPSIIVDPEFNRLFLVGETPGRNVHDLFWKAVQSWRELKKGRIDPTSLNVLLAAIEVQLLARDSPEDEKRLAEWQKYFSQALNSVPPIDTKTPVFTIELESIETHSLCRVVDDPAASGGKAMTYTSNNAWIEIGLALPAGRYRIRVLGKGTASTSDAIFITVDGKGRQRTYFPLDRFAWKDAVFGSERPGRRRIRILHAEPEVLLDRLEIYRR
jgi:hypothetical protein